jgi:pimeloyl-ACP methyl ester carboxylesterase
VTFARIPARDPAHRRGVIVGTGGGPGGAGVPQSLVLDRNLGPEVRDHYDLIGVDQRFIERSTPITCGQPTEDSSEFWVRSPLIPFEAVAAEAKARAEACRASAGWALPFATTANAARDLDVIRAALHEPRLNLLVSSYAADVGAAYTKLFPQHTGRVVLDSVPDPDLIWRDFERARSATFQAAFERWCAWTADRDATYRLGTTGADVCAAWWALVGRLSAAPQGFWTGDVLGGVTFTTLYDDHANPTLSAIEAELVAGGVPNPPPSFPVARDPAAPADNHSAASLAYRCGDARWPRDPATYQAAVAGDGAAYPFVGGYDANITPCAFWPVDQDARVPMTGTHAPGGLVVAATGDGATPYAGSVHVHRQWPGSRLVTLEAGVHAPLQAYGDTCVQAVVDRFLATGALPRTDVTCPGSLS